MMHMAAGLMLQSVCAILYGLLLRLESNDLHSHVHVFNCHVYIRLWHCCDYGWLHPTTLQRTSPEVTHQCGLPLYLHSDIQSAHAESNSVSSRNGPAIHCYHADKSIWMSEMKQACVSCVLEHAG
jgi:hypothetical protein